MTNYYNYKYFPFHNGTGTAPDASMAPYSDPVHARSAVHEGCPLSHAGAVSAYQPIKAPTSPIPQVPPRFYTRLEDEAVVTTESPEVKDSCGL